jgi:preprotein translocase subunit SecA
MDHLKEGIGLRGYGQQDPLVAYKKESFDMFEGMMGRFQEDTVRFLFLMQIVGPDGQPVTEMPRRQAPEITSQSIPEPARALPQPTAPVVAEANGSHPVPAPPPSRPLPVPVRAPSTTIDALEQEFQRKKKRELEQARMTGANGSSEAPAQRRSGEKVGRNDLCPCGSGKKYKKCHGLDA